MPSKYLSDDSSQLQYNKLYPTDYIFMLIIAICSIVGINAYHFGLVDQSVFLSIYKFRIDPSQFAQDEWANHVIPYYYSWFWPILSWVKNVVPIATEYLFFIFYVLFFIYSLSGFFRLSLAITNDRGASFLALAMFIFSINLAPTSYTIDSQLIATHAALPFILHGIWLWLSGKPIQGYALLGIASLCHPLYAIYTLIFTLPFGFSPIYPRPLREVISSVLAFVITSSPIWIWFILKPSPGLDLFYYDSIWLKQIILSGSEIWNILDWPWFRQVSTILALFAILWCALSLPTSNSIRWFSVALAPLFLIFLLISMFFYAVSPFPMMLQLQWIKSLPLIVLLSLPSISLFLRNEVFNQGFTKGGIVVTLIISSLFFPQDALKGTFFIATILLVMLYLRSTSSRSYYERTLPLLLAIALSMVSTFYFFYGVRFSLFKTEDLEWQSIQEWARKNTEKEAVFVFNPSKSGFRAGSGRSVWLDWYEGRLGMYSIPFSKNWLAKTEILKAKSIKEASTQFDKLSYKQLKKIAAEKRNIPYYAVLKTNHSVPLVPITESRNYKIVKIQ